MDFNYALAAVSPKVEAAFLARFALNIWLNSMSKSKWKLLHTCGRYVSFELVFLWVTTSLTNHGTSFGCGQVNWSRTGRVCSFLSNSICPHFNFLSFYALLRINVPRLLPLPNRPPHWHHQSSTAKHFAYVTFTHLPIDRTRRRVWKKTPTLQLMWLICQFRPVHILGGSSLHAAWQMSKRPRANMINYSRLLRDGQVIGDNKYAIRFMQL